MSCQIMFEGAALVTSISDQDDTKLYLNGAKSFYMPCCQDITACSGLAGNAKVYYELKVSPTMSPSTMLATYELIVNNQTFPIRRLMTYENNTNTWRSSTPITVAQSGPGKLPFVQSHITQLEMTDLKFSRGSTYSINIIARLVVGLHL